MSEQTMSAALNAVHEEALKLLSHTLPGEAMRKVELIISIAKHKRDVRSQTSQPKGYQEVEEEEE